MGRSEDKVALGLEVAGRGVLDALAVRPAGSVPAVTPLPAVDQSDVIEQIKKLGELHAAGVLSDEEFSSKKTELLNRI